MNLNKLNDKEKLDLCRKYYLAGFALLPFLWIVNFFWFFKHAFIRKPFPEQNQMKKYLVISAIGSVAWVVLLMTWNVLFQVYRVDMDAIGDYLTFIVPRGKA